MAITDDLATALSLPAGTGVACTIVSSSSRELPLVIVSPAHQQTVLIWRTESVATTHHPSDRVRQMLILHRGLGSSRASGLLR